MKTRILLCVVVMAAMIGGGCQRHAIKAPTISVAGIWLEPSRPGDQGVRVMVTLKLENPNEVALPLTFAKYEVMLEGFGSYADQEQTERIVPAKGSQIVELPAVFNTNGQSAVGRLCGAKGEMRYEPPGQMRRVYTDLSIPLPHIEFDSANRLALPWTEYVPATAPATQP